MAASPVVDEQVTQTAEPIEWLLLPGGRLAVVDRPKICAVERGLERRW